MYDVSSAIKFVTTVADISKKKSNPFLFNTGTVFEIFSNYHLPLIH